MSKTKLTHTAGARCQVIWLVKTVQNLFVEYREACGHSPTSSVKMIGFCRTVCDELHPVFLN